MEEKSNEKLIVKNVDGTVKEVNYKLLENLAEDFLIGDPVNVKELGNGNINMTYNIFTKDGESYVLQKINKEVFKKPEQVMENIKSVTRYLKKQISVECGDPERETLFPVDTLDGKSFHKDKNGEYWRMYGMIEGARTYSEIDNPQMYGKIGAAFGKFQKRMTNYDASQLEEAIPDFHNTPKRYKDFLVAVRDDKAGRIEAIKGKNNHSLKQAIDYLISKKEDIEFIKKGIDDGSLPLRVTHNDTKVDNIMVDNETKEPICVIDLDTVGPDSVLVDYGDGIRSGTNKAGEKTYNLEEVYMDNEHFEEYTKGFLGEVKDSLTKKELEGIYKAPRIMTLELGFRFLADYINGDTYFILKEEDPKDLNLQRALVQIKLSQDMEEKEKYMKEYIESIVNVKDERNEELEL